MVIHVKYNLKEGLDQEFEVQTASYLWKGIVAASEDVVLGLKWEIGNGCRALFWADNWVGNLGPLHRLSYAPIADWSLAKPVQDFPMTDANGIGRNSVSFPLPIFFRRLVM